MKNKKIFYAVSTLVGMIVGVGIFGIPYCFAQAGFLIGFLYLILLTGAVLLIHFFYGEIVLRTEGEHRLAGYAEKYLGARAKKIAAATIIFEFYGALLAYLIVGGQFLNVIFHNLLGGNDFIWTIVFFFFGSLVILFGIKKIGFLECFMFLFLLAIAGLLVAKGAPFVNFDNFKQIDLLKLFLPYGVILFSLTGSSAIPEIRQLLDGQEHKLKKAIAWGTIIPAVVYLIFAFVVVGVSGLGTTEKAIDGLVPYLGRGIIMIGAIFGALVVLDSFWILGLNLQKVFQFDYKINKFLAWGLACFVPLAIFLLGINNFIFVVGLVGALAGGLEGVLIILTYLAAKKRGDRQPEYNLKLGKSFAYALIFLLSLGVIYQFVYLTR